VFQYFREALYLVTTAVTNSRFGKQFSRLLLRIHVQRSSAFYLTNVALILLGVTSLGLCSAAYAPTDMAGGSLRTSARLTLNLLLLLCASV